MTNETSAEKKTFLDILIEASKTDFTLCDDDIRQEVNTFLFEVSTILICRTYLYVYVKVLAINITPFS